MTTIEFYDFVMNLQNTSVANLDFIIGGAEGLAPEVREKSNYVLSLGKMVFPHFMVRVILIEQLYRVWTIKNNHPYHK